MVTVTGAQVLFAVLALVANVGVVTVFVALLCRSRWRRARQLLVSIRPLALFLAWLVAGVAMIGSLYFSEVAHYEPCRLCWYQRIAMYPIAVILAIAVAKRDYGVRKYVVPIVLLGAVISMYHYLIEWYPNLEGDGTCSVAVPCNFVWFRRFGFVTLPYMALSGFLFIATFASLRPKEKSR
jgi:disulfide bond formation protein DsbB